MCLVKIKLIESDFENHMIKIVGNTMKDLIKVKNQAISDLADNVKKDNCNGILDLTLRYEVIDGRGTMCIVTAHGTGVNYN